MKRARRHTLRRPRRCHKGDFGHVWILAGTGGTAGAGRLAAEAAMRAGAGKTTWVTTREAYRVMGRAIPEVMSLTFPEAGRSASGLPAASVPHILKQVLASATAVAVGPGLGRTPVTRRLVRALIARCRVPLVLDADALWALEGHPQLLKKAFCPAILTPHDGEFARLFGAAAARSPQTFRGSVAKRVANQYHCVLVWKGPRTRVVSAAGAAFLNDTGNPGLAKGGSGDVLTGVIAALAAQGFSPFDAARIGVHAHGRAADIAVRSTGTTSLAASDVIRALPAALSELEKKRILTDL